MWEIIQVGWTLQGTPLPDTWGLQSWATSSSTSLSSLGELKQCVFKYSRHFLVPRSSLAVCPMQTIPDAFRLQDQVSRFWACRLKGLERSPSLYIFSFSSRPGGSGSQDWEENMWRPHPLPAWHVLLFSLVSLFLFSYSVISDSLPPHGLKHASLPCPSPSPGVCSNSCLLSWWCHRIISSSVILFSSCPQSFPASGSFPMSWLFASGGQSTGVSASASILPMNIQDWFPLGLAGLISLQSRGLSRVFSNTIVWKHQSFSTQPYLWSNSYIHTWLLEKP